MKTKICRKCGLKKDTETGFYKNKNNKDGLYSHCVACHRETARRYSKTEKGKITTNKKSERNYIKFFDKVRARQRLRRAVYGGKITRPDVCDSCQTS